MVYQMFFRYRRVLPEGPTKTSRESMDKKDIKTPGEIPGERGVGFSGICL
jgi:hypothetical protein